MRWLIPLSLAVLAACGTKDEGTDTDTAEPGGDSDLGRDTRVPDSDDPVDTSGGGNGGTGLCPSADTNDPFWATPVGETPYDGEYAGRFRFREVYPRGAPWNRISPTCEGNAAATVDGCGIAHISLTVQCAEDAWDPNMTTVPLTFPVPFPFPGGLPNFAEPYGDLSGFGTANFDDPADTEVRVEVNMSVVGTMLYPLEGVGGQGIGMTAELSEGNRIDIEWSRTQGFALLRTDQSFVASLCKVGSSCTAELPEIPEDTAAPIDTSDTGDTADSAVN